MALKNQNGHRQRVKDRFLADGLDGFEPHNVLELVLFYAIPQRDTKETAYALIEHFGSFKGVLDASSDELTDVKGIGENAATLIKMLPQIARYYINDCVNNDLVLDSSDKAGAFIKPKFIGRTNEIVYLICLDAKKKLLICKIIEEGTINSTPITIRKIVEIAMRVGAESIILAHNHPQGFALPSRDDIHTTRSLKSALAGVSVNLADHIIVADNDFISMSQSGLI